MALKSTLRAAAFLSLSAIAPVAHAKSDGNVLEGVGMTGSESMMMFALSDYRLPRDFHEARLALAKRMGLVGTPGQVTDSWIDFAPVLTYDGNINGGSVGESVTISGLEFRVEDDYRAKGGLLVGTQVTAGLRMNVGERTALELDGYAMAAWAPEHDMTKTRVQGSACLRRMVNDRVQVRGCLDGYHSSYELGETRRAGVEAGMSYAFASFAAFHEIDVSLKQSRYFDDEDYNQTTVAAIYTTGRPGPLAFTAGVQLGTEVEDRIAMREAFMAGVSMMVLDRPTSFLVSLQNNRGGMFLGEGRDERVYAVSANRRVHDHLTVGAAYSVTEASHEFFQDNAFGVTFNVRF